jgi:hypothetical protein
MVVSIVANNNHGIISDIYPMGKAIGRTSSHRSQVDRRSILGELSSLRIGKRITVESIKMIKLYTSTTLAQSQLSGRLFSIIKLPTIKLVKRVYL